MRSYPSAFSACMNRRDGALPVWLMRFTANGIDYLLDQDGVTIAPWSRTALPLIASWGKINEGVTGLLNEIQISDLDVDLINDPNAAPNMRTHAKAGQLRGLPVSIYLWFLDCTDPPQEIYRFRINDMELPEDDTLVRLVLQDESCRFENLYPGEVLSSETYPKADPDDIGKTIPQVYGTVEKNRCLCVDSGWVTSLTALITAAAVSFPVSALPAASVTGRTIQIDDEKMLVTGVAGTTLTVTRAYGGTTAVEHTKNSTVMEVKATPLIYMACAKALAAIGTIYARANGIDIDITSGCTKYLGTSANQHPDYPGRAVIAIADIPHVANRITLEINDAQHDHASSSTLSAAATNTPSSAYEFNRFGDSRWTFAAQLPAPPTGVTKITDTIVIQKLIQYTAPWSIYITDAAGAHVLTDQFDGYTIGQQVTYTYERTSGGFEDTALYVSTPAGAASAAIKIVSAKRDYAYTGATSTQSANVTLSGNSVSDIMIGEAVLADCVGAITAPNDVVADLLGMPCAVKGSATGWDIGGTPAIPAVPAVLGEVLTAHGFSPDVPANYDFHLPVTATLTSSGSDTLAGAAWARGTDWSGAAFPLGYLHSSNWATSATDCTAPWNKVAGQTYRLTVTVTAMSDGGAIEFFPFFSSMAGLSISAPGTYTLDVTATETGTDTCRLRGFYGTVTVSAVSIVPVTIQRTGDWILSGAMAVNGSLACTGVGSAVITFTPEAGVRYCLFYAISGFTAGSFQVQGTNTGQISSHAAGTLPTGVVMDSFVASGAGDITIGFFSSDAATRFTITQAEIFIVDTHAADTPAVPGVPAVPGITYAFNGVVNTSKKALEWCHAIALQCRSYFRFVLGQPTLIIRPNAIISAKSIATCRLTDGRKAHSEKLSDSADIINTVNLLYDRDWSQNGSDAYRKTAKGTHAASIGIHGTKERPELFKYDFIAVPALAADLVAFYLAVYPWQRWIHDQEVYLSEADLEFSDGVNLGFSAGEVCEGIAIGFNPGKLGEISKINLKTVEAAN